MPGPEQTGQMFSVLMRKNSFMRGQLLITLARSRPPAKRFIHYLFTRTLPCVTLSTRDDHRVMKVVVQQTMSWLFGRQLRLHLICLLPISTYRTAFVI